ncbi:MAG: hypothetical protein AAFY46_07115 [Planctomycetota bacterium]
MAHRILTSFTALAAAFPLTIAAQTVVVGPGETLTRADLDAGVFNGQPFVLGPATRFIVEGGAIRSIRNGSMPFELRGSHVVLTDSALIDGFSDLANVDLRAADTTIEELFVSGQSSVLIERSDAEWIVVGGDVTFDMHQSIAEEIGAAALLGSSITGSTIQALRVAGPCTLIASSVNTMNVGAPVSAPIIIRESDISLLRGDGPIDGPHGASIEFDSGIIGSLRLEDGPVRAFRMRGGSIDGFMSVVGSGSAVPRQQIELLGGTIDTSLRVLGSPRLVVDGALVSNGIRDDLGFTRGVVTLRSGTVGIGLDTRNLTMTGGLVTSDVNVGGNAASIAGGRIEGRLRLPDAGVSWIAGGTFDGGLLIAGSVTVVIRASDASLDGTPIPLEPGQPITVTNTDGLALEATLNDGSPFELQLAGGPDFVGDDVRIVLLSGQPSCIADNDLDGDIDADDQTGFIGALLTADPACDQNGDGLCDPADFNAWIINANAGCG